jgi:hypothetical protein
LFNPNTPSVPPPGVWWDGYRPTRHSPYWQCFIHYLFFLNYYVSSSYEKREEKVGHKGFSSSNGSVVG